MDEECVGEFANRKGVYMLTCIKERRSVRKFTSENISDAAIDEIIEAGIWAPSGLNNQPWKFVVIRDKVLRDTLAGLTTSTAIMQRAPVLIAVFLDTAESYHREKDIQAIGACIQNMLLTIHAGSLGGVWLGEILKNRVQVEKILEVPPGVELMAVIAVGRPGEHKAGAQRKPLREVIIDRK